ncbi:peptidylprolyl isomerase [Roseivivax sp. CAU 1761]
MQELLKTLAPRADRLRAGLRPLALATALGLAALPGAAPAQNLFGPAITVNEEVITGYELQQRARMNEVLNAPGNPSEVARTQLIDDRLKLAAARRQGIVPSEAEIAEGMDEFAGRADLSRAEFVQRLGQAGIAEQTFRDFVRAGVAWRNLVRERFGAESAVPEIRIERAERALQAEGSAVRVALSEIIIPAPPPQAERAMALAQEISTYRSEAQFAAAARQYSATPSRAEGGRLPWQDLTDLPPVLQRIALSLSPGEVSDPLPIQNGVAIFQLRGVEEAGYRPAEVARVDYAIYHLPGGRSRETLARARVIAETTDRCDDLYGLAQGQPQSRLQRQEAAPGQIPTEIAFELSKLDPGEISTALTGGSGETLMVLMLCDRTRARPTGEGETAEEARQALELSLRNQRLGQLSERYLAQLRAEARIVER